MRRFDVRWIPLVIAAGAFAGSTLVSSVAVANDESPPIDEPVLVLEPAAVDPAPTTPSLTDPSTTDEGDSRSADVDRVGDVVSVEPPDPPPFDDLAVVDMVVPHVETMVEMPASDIVAVEGAPTDPALVDVVDGAATLDEPAAPLTAPAPDASLMTEEPDEGHEGGSGGQGNPYRMTFNVSWLDPNGMPIAVLDAALPTDWRTVFELSASSTTGQGMPTSATCTYPAGSDVLHCVFDNPGHGSGADGLVVPARPTATYTVTVTWPTTGWTITGANAGPYSARDLCPRGGEGGGDEGGGGEEGGGGHEGGGHEGGGEEGSGGQEGGGEEGGGGQEGGGHGIYCEHTVVLQQIALPTVPPTEPPTVPPTEPPTVAPTVPPAVVEPEVEVQALPPVVAPPAATQTDPEIAAAPAATAPRSLPITGGSVAMILLIAALLVAIGSVAAGLARRTS